MPRAAPPATADDGSSTAAAPEPSMTSVSTTTVTDPSSVNTESAGVEDAESSQGGKPTQLESGHDLTAEEEALLCSRRESDTTQLVGPRTRRPQSGRSGAATGRPPAGRRHESARDGIQHRGQGKVTTPLGPRRSGTLEEKGKSSGH